MRWWNSRFSNPSGAPFGPPNPGVLLGESLRSSLWDCLSSSREIWRSLSKHADLENNLTQPRRWQTRLLCPLRLSLVCSNLISWAQKQKPPPPTPPPTLLQVYLQASPCSSSPRVFTVESSSNFKAPHSKVFLFFFFFPLNKGIFLCNSHDFPAHKQR